MSPSQLPLPSSTNPTRLKNQFAHRFLRALNHLNFKKRPARRDDHISRRSRRVKIAAYTAMASVVGSRRAWSRAVLWKIRNRSRNQGFLVRTAGTKRRVLDHHKLHHAKVSVKRRSSNSKREEDVDPFGYSGQESRLRKLVPGAETMDSCCLMDETVDYIKCLAAQVEVMKTLVDLYSTT